MTTNNWKNEISLRKYSNSDIPFMQQLYASTRESELAMTNFSVEEKERFISQQFTAQLAHYTQYYCADSFHIIELNNQPIGRLFVDYWENEIRIVDIALMPQYRNSGIGTYYFEKLFAQARELNQPISIHVEHSNPAKKLYERLGFTLKTQTNDIYLLMQWCP
ncbi:GNAT family N-acetyltransferase [Pseudoalteromonas pernae]|uniref:GNAT family N-acetyltransferase n=1 Tax=Pseudoalteromonas pernae TaxID=3118054 RepID=UPI003241D8F8